MSKPSGLTQSTTILPSSSERSDSRRDLCPSHGTATITMSASEAAPEFSAPRTGRPGPRLSAASWARVALRDPITTECPASANLRASPLP